MAGLTGMARSSSVSPFLRVMPLPPPQLG